MLDTKIQKYFFLFLFDHFINDFYCKVRNLHSTDDGKSCEKSHGATNG